MEFMKERDLGGVLPVFQMPYDDSENIDFNTLEKEIDWLYENECDGIVFALASEIIRLTEMERKKVAEKICKYNKDRGCVIVFRCRCCDGYTSYFESLS